MTSTCLPDGILHINSNICQQEILTSNVEGEIKFFSKNKRKKRTQKKNQIKKKLKKLPQKKKKKKKRGSNRMEETTIRKQSLK